MISTFHKTRMCFFCPFLTSLHVSTGIKHNFQVNEIADLADRNVFAEKLGKTVTHIEGVPVSYTVA